MTLAEYRKRKGAAAGEAQVEHEAHGEHHPAALEYVQIGAILAIITAVEVGIYYIGLSFTMLVVSLMALSAIKFTMVVLWFMHLKFDNRLFSGMFVLGLVLAMLIFAVALSTVGGKLI